MSGLTIGRGYDMGTRTEEEIKRDLKAAGVDKDKAALIAKASGLQGAAAPKFVTEATDPTLGLPGPRRARPRGGSSHEPMQASARARPTGAPPGRKGFSCLFPNTPPFHLCRRVPTDEKPCALRLEHQHAAGALQNFPPSHPAKRGGGGHRKRIGGLLVRL
jgi:hypothetical protein